MTRVIAVGSQKGGIGKTTTTANLAAAWGALGEPDSERGESRGNGSLLKDPVPRGR